MDINIKCEYDMYDYQNKVYEILWFLKEKGNNNSSINELIDDLKKIEIDIREIYSREDIWNKGVNLLITLKSEIDIILDIQSSESVTINEYFVNRVVNGLKSVKDMWTQDLKEYKVITDKYDRLSKLQDEIQDRLSEFKEILKGTFPHHYDNAFWSYQNGLSRIFFMLEDMTSDVSRNPIEGEHHQIPWGRH